MVAAKAASASSQKNAPMRSGAGFPRCALRVTPGAGDCRWPGRIRRELADLRQKFGGVSALPGRSPSSKAPISLPRTRSGAIQRNHALEMLPVALKRCRSARGPVFGARGVHQRMNVPGQQREHRSLRKGGEAGHRHGRQHGRLFFKRNSAPAQAFTAIMTSCRPRPLSGEDRARRSAPVQDRPGAASPCR